MSELLFHYQRVPAATWVYLSSLLTIALYFKFSRLWSIRNLDIIGMILLSPGLLMVEYAWQHGGAENIERSGFVMLFGFGLLLLFRLLLDPLMTRRPLLEPNLSVGGLTFLCVSLMIFLMANVLTSRVTEDDLVGAKQSEHLGPADAGNDPGEQQIGFATHGPGYPLTFLLPRISTQAIMSDRANLPQDSQAEQMVHRDAVRQATARTTAILSHLAIVLGMIIIGYRHFDNIRTGIASATLYLMLPYTAVLTGHVGHALPAALLVWAVAAYRRPLVAGMLMGLAIGVIYYPAFLLPLWISFYWQRGLMRFVAGVLSMVLLLVGVLALVAMDWSQFAMDWAQFAAWVSQMFGWRTPVMDPEKLGGLWKFLVPYYRWPVLAAFVSLCFSFALWPSQKNLGTLMSCSAAVMLGTQYWHPQGGGLYMAWYLPLALLTVFRPNLEDRVALSVLGEGWRPIRRVREHSMEQAA